MCCNAAMKSLELSLESSHDFNSRPPKFIPSSLKAFNSFMKSSVKALVSGDFWLDTSFGGRVIENGHFFPEVKNVSENHAMLVSKAAKNSCC